MAHYAYPQRRRHAGVPLPLHFYLRAHSRYYFLSLYFHHRLYPGASEPYRAKKDSWSEEPTGEPTEEEIGFINTPIGEPFILLLFGLLMSLVIYRKKRATS